MVKTSALDAHSSPTTAVLQSRTSGDVSHMKEHVASRTVV